MEKKRTIIISTFLLLVTMLLLIYKVGDVSKKVNEQNGKIEKMERNLTKSINGISYKSEENKKENEALTASLIYSFDKYDLEAGTVKSNFSLVPRQISENTEVSLISGNVVIPLEKESMTFQGSYEYGLRDKFLNLVTYGNNGTVTVDALPNDQYNIPVGEMILPKLSLEKKSVTSNISEASYDMNAVVKVKLENSKKEIAGESAARPVKFTKLDFITEINGKIVDDQELNYRATGFQDEFNDLVFKKEFSKIEGFDLKNILEDNKDLELENEEKDKATGSDNGAKADKDKKPKPLVKNYLQATDEYGLQHRAYLDIKNDKKEFVEGDVVKVYNPKGEIVFEYQY